MTIDICLIVLGLIVLAFFSGLKLAERYYRMILAEEQYVNRVLYMSNGLGYVARHESSMPIGHDFMEQLSKTGKATQFLKRSGKVPLKGF